MNNSPPEFHDTERLLHGVRRIARFLGLSERQTRYLINTRRLPAFKIGDRYVARPTTLTALLDQLEKQAASESEPTSA